MNGNKAPGSGLCDSGGRKGVEETVDGGQGATGGGTEVREECVERECGAEDAVLQLDQGQGGSGPPGGDAVAMALGHAFDQALEAEAAEVVGRLGGGIGSAATQVWKHRADVSSAEAQWGEGADGEAAEGGLQGEGPGVAEAQGRHALTFHDGRCEHLVDTRDVLQAPGGGFLRREQATVEGAAECDELGQVLQGTPDANVIGVVDGGLGAQGAALLA